MWRSRAVALALVAGTLACHPDRSPGPALTSRTLPGFTISLPAGVPALEQIGGYEQGALFYGKRGARIGVAWVAGEAMDGVALAQEVSAVAAVEQVAGPVEATTATFDALGRPATTVTSSGGELLVSLVRCGGRDLVVSSEGTPADVTRHRAVLASLRCSPDPAREPATQQPPPIVLAPDGLAWEVPGDDDAATSPDGATWESDAGAVAFVWALELGEGVLPALDEFVDDLGKVTTKTIDGRVIHMTQSEWVHVGEMTVAVAAVPCGARTVLGLALRDGESTDTRALDALAHAHCRP